MSERSLEARVFDALVRNTDGGRVTFKDHWTPESLSLAISTALTLARREGYEAARRHLKGIAFAQEDPIWERGMVHDRDAAFSLPTRTVRKLREEPDPHFFPNEDGEVTMYKFDDGILMAKVGRDRWSSHLPPAFENRIALWHDLIQRPYHEEQAPADPNEVLP